MQCKCARHIKQPIVGGRGSHPGGEWENGPTRDSSGACPNESPLHKTSSGGTGIVTAGVWSLFQVGQNLCCDCQMGEGPPGQAFGRKPMPCYVVTKMNVLD